MRRHARRTAIATLFLAAAATASLTGCQSGQDDDSTSGGTTRSAASDGTEQSGDSTSGPASASPSASTPASKGPFAGLTGTEISELALKATTKARSLRMTGDVPDDENGATIRIDIALDRRGECAGTMSLDGQGEAELIKTGDTLYLKYDERFLRAQSKGEPQADTEALVSLLAGRWTSMSANGADAKDMTGFCDLDTLLKDMDADGTDGTDSQVTRGGTTTVDGAPAITLRATDGEDRTRLYVATEGEPYLLRLDSGSEQEPGSVTFSAYDEPVPAEKPAGEILDLDGANGASGARA